MDSVFRRVYKIAKSNYYLGHVRLSAWNDSTLTGRMLMKFEIKVFFKKNLFGKFKFY
jgi:hypothetical protein